MKAKEAWAIVSAAFSELESLAEACEDNRLDNHLNLQEAFDKVDSIIEDYVGDDELLDSAQRYAEGDRDRRSRARRAIES